MNLKERGIYRYGLCGNIGLAQEWDLIINLAKEIKDLK